MRRIGLAIVLTIAVGLLLALAQTGTTGSARPASIKAPWERGDQYIYQRFFAQVTRVNNEAAEAERLGMNSLYLRDYFQTAAQLQASQALLLNQVATELAASLAQYDAKAAEVRTKWHILVQTKRLHKEPIPPIPAEISALQPARDALILQARDRLRVGLGEAEFARLDAYVRSTVAAKPRTETGPLQQQPAVDEARITRAQYKAFFRSIAYLNTKAEEERKLGFTELAAGVQTIMQRQAGLSDEQAQTLNRVTSEYFQTLAKYKPQADAARLAYTKLRLEMLAQRGKITPSPELTAAQASLAAVTKQMDYTTDEAIRRLQSSFGEEEFGRLETFVKQRMKRSQTGTPVSTDSAIQEVTR